MSLYFIELYTNIVEIGEIDEAVEIDKESDDILVKRRYEESLRYFKKIKNYFYTIYTFYCKYIFVKPYRNRNLK